MARLEDIITSKVKVEFEEDFYAMTVLCYLKSNAEKYHITIDKQAQNLHNCLMILTVQLTMLICMLYSIATEESNPEEEKESPELSVLIVKLPCAIALHLSLYDGCVLPQLHRQDFQ